ncbi:MAG TPA: adenylate/guanylate cyclase domain-containing protein, partial [Leptospiraceae bacterium]|nr:adenylate/guanylate cyclase domain-containing protein [Leptospiraceae bacterium]
FTEISVISVAIWIHVLVEEPLVGLNAPPLMLYGIFILSLALFLEARHCISAGFIAAIQYAWIINSVHKMSGKTHIDGSFYSKAIFLALTGIAASIVASQIRNQLVNTFQAQLNAQEQMLAQKQSALEEQKRITEAYSRFVPSEFLLLLSKTDIRQVELGDCIHKEMSILFSDIRNFTQLSERMTPKQNFDFINLYLKQVGPLIQFHSGYIDKYIGDAVMALFNRSADDAVHAAISMLNQLKNSLNETDIKIGIGINTGPVMLGTVGEANRMEGTVISDAVNLASRLENLNKEYGTEILISEFTLNNMKNPEQFCIRRIDKVRVKGKNQDVEIFEILG